MRKGFGWVGGCRLREKSADVEEKDGSLGNGQRCDICPLGLPICRQRERSEPCWTSKTRFTEEISTQVHNPR